MDETTAGLMGGATAGSGAAGTAAGGASITAATNNPTASGAGGSSSSSSSAAGGGATVVQLQQRKRQQYFFRTMSSVGTDAGGGWPGGGDSTVTPRSAGDFAGYAAGEGLRQLAWSLAVNGALALLLLGLVEAVVLPVLIASLELTPSPHVSKLLTALLTAHLFQVGARGTIVLLLAVGGSALGLLLTGAWDRGFVPLFLAWYVGLDTLARIVGHGAGGMGNGLPSTSSGLGGGGGGLKTLSETSSARERGWSPVARWRLWGA